MRILFLSPMETNGNSFYSELTPNGFIQSESAAKLLFHFRLDHIYCACDLSILQSLKYFLDRSGGRISFENALNRDNCNKGIGDMPIRYQKYINYYYHPLLKSDDVPIFDINERTNNISDYFSLNKVNRELAEENARLRELLIEATKISLDSFLTK